MWVVSSILQQQAQADLQKTSAQEVRSKHKAGMTDGATSSQPGSTQALSGNSDHHSSLGNAAADLSPWQTADALISGREPVCTAPASDLPAVQWRP